MTGAAGATGPALGLVGVAAPVAVANVETVVVACVIPAGTLVAGATYRVTAWYTRVGSNGATPTIRIRIGPTTLTGNAAASLTGIGSGVASRVTTGMITIRTTGAGGSAIGAMSEIQSAVAPVVSAAAATVAVDTTVQNRLELTFISGNVANTYTFQVAAIERVV